MCSWWQVSESWHSQQSSRKQVFVLQSQLFDMTAVRIKYQAWNREFNGATASNSGRDLRFRGKVLCSECNFSATNFDETWTK